MFFFGAIKPFRSGGRQVKSGPICWKILQRAEIVSDVRGRVNSHNAELLYFSFKEFQPILKPKPRSRGLAKSKNKFIYAIPILVLLFSIGLYFLFGESLQNFFEGESQTEIIEESPEEIKEELSFLRARVHKLAANL